MVMIVSQSDILETRKLMMKIYAQLEPFDFEQSPPNDNVVRIQRPLTTLDSGD